MINLYPAASGGANPTSYTELGDHREAASQHTAAVMLGWMLISSWAYATTQRRSRSARWVREFFSVDDSALQSQSSRPNDPNTCHQISKFACHKFYECRRRKLLLWTPFTESTHTPPLPTTERSK